MATAVRRQGGIVLSELTEHILGAAIEVHRHWGPGLYEEIYERSLCRELALRGVAFETQVRLPLVYKGEAVGDDLRLDVWVKRQVMEALCPLERKTSVSSCPPWSSRGS